MKKQIQKRTPEEKEKLLLDIQKMGVTAGCRQFDLSKTQYYGWLGKYTAHGIEGLIDRWAQNTESLIKKLVKENKALKELLAEEKLVSRMKDELLKKVCTTDDKRKMIGKHVSMVLPVVVASSCCSVAKSTYYYKSNGRKMGKKPSITTMKLYGTLVSNSVADEIIESITHDFTDYGYQLSTDYLKQHDYVINKKEVYRLMKENRLLHPSVKRGKNNDKQ